MGLEPGEAQPPKPRIALRIGVAGHRPHRLPDAEGIRPAVGRVLEQLGEGLTDLPPGLLAMSSRDRPVLRVITGLAEGADRLAASEALALGERATGIEVEVQAILPFPREEYLEDFPDDASREEFEALVAKLAGVLELDGSHQGVDAAGRSYEYLGEMLLRACDVLVAVWDGQPSQGRGGTAFVVARALALGMPVAWIDVRDGEARLSVPRTAGWQVCTSATARELVLDLLLPPSDEARTAADLYLAERRPGRRLLRRAWAAFRVLGMPFGVSDPHRGAAPAALPMPPAAGRHYVWANELAIAYAERFRGSLLVISAAAALAVMVSVFASAVEHETRGAIAVLVIISLATCVWVWGTRGGWHERWIDYRLLAELLRDLGALQPLGAGPPAARHPAHAAFGDPGTTWVAWHVRRVQREVGLPAARIDVPYLREVRAALRDAWLGEQIAYHEANARFHKRLDRRLAAVGFASFIFTLVALVWFIATDRDDLRLLEAGLPALAAWFATIRGQAELGRVGRRSAAMADGLAHLQRELLEIPLAGDVVASRELVVAAEGAANTMVSELLDWRVMFGDRRLGLPG